MNFEEELEKLPFLPVFNRVVIKRYEIKQTASGFYLPQEARQGSMRMSQGLVLAVGEDAVGVKAGQKVVFGRYAGTVIATKDGEYTTMNDEDVLGILKGDFFDGK